MSRHIGVVIGASSPFEADLIDELYRAADDVGYRLALGMHSATRSRARAVDDLAAQGCAVVIVVGAEYGDRFDVDVPIVIVGERLPNLNVVTIGTDEWRGAHLAVQYLIDLGHSAIAHIEGGEHPCAAERLRGYLGAMTAAGYRDECRTLVGDYTEEAGALAAERMLAEGNLPTAVFLANDRMAVGFIDVMRNNGIRIPDDMSIVGYDDGPHAVLGHVNLTTIRQDVAGLAGATIEAVASLVGDSDRAANTGGFGFYGSIALEPELMVRGTTSPPAGWDPDAPTTAPPVRWGARRHLRRPPRPRTRHARKSLRCNRSRRQRVHGGCLGDRRPPRDHGQLRTLRGPHRRSGDRRHLRCAARGPGRDLGAQSEGGGEDRGDIARLTRPPQS